MLWPRKRRKGVPFVHFWAHEEVSFRLCVNEASVLMGILARVRGASTAGGPWQVKLKSLCVLEAMIRRAQDQASSAPVCRVVMEVFAGSPYAVESGLDSPQSSVKDKARKVGSPEVQGHPRQTDQTGVVMNNGVMMLLKEAWFS